MFKTACSIVFVICLLGFYVDTTGAEFSENYGQTSTAHPYQTISEAAFREIFYQYLCSHLMKQRNDVVVSKMKIVGNNPVPAGKLSFQIFQKNRKKLKGNVSLTVVIKVDDVVKNNVRVSGWVDVFEPVVCASRDLKRGEIIKEDDLYATKQNISHLSSKIISDAVKIIGLMTKHNISADTSLKEWMFEKSPVVDKGDIVTILAESGDLRVTVPGKVLMKGYEGELIKVQNLMSKKEIYAKVVDNSTVTVTF